MNLGILKTELNTDIIEKGRHGFYILLLYFYYCGGRINTKSDLPRKVNGRKYNCLTLVLISEHFLRWK